jgi:hypothetical protein
MEPTRRHSASPHIPDYLKPVIQTAYITGWRIQSEILTRQSRFSAFALNAAAQQAADTQHMLQGLARVFTRFETISMDLDALMSLDISPLADYRHQLEKVINNAVDDFTDIDDPVGWQVLEAAGGVPEIFETEFSYDPLPLKTVAGQRSAIIEGSTIGNTYLFNFVPYVAVFKHPVDPKTLAFFNLAVPRLWPRIVQAGAAGKPAHAVSPLTAMRSVRWPVIGPSRK